MNCATELLDKPVTRGHGHRVALRSADGECTYTQLFTQANRLANVLVREMGLKPGNRVLLRGPNNPTMAAAWFAVMKAGGICGARMPPAFIDRKSTPLNSTHRCIPIAACRL